MKKSIFIIATSLFVCGLVNAQEVQVLIEPEKQKDIVETLNANNPGQGKVTVYQDDTVKAATIIYRADTLSSMVKVRGYRIAVYSDNKESAKREAESILSKIKSVYPQIDANITYQSPRWRLRVGNYLTAVEATEAISDMKKSLPTYITREMKPISEVVVRRVGNE